MLLTKISYNNMQRISTSRGRSVDISRTELYKPPKYGVMSGGYNVLFNELTVVNRYRASTIISTAGDNRKARAS